MSGDAVAALRATGLVKRFEHTCAIDGVELELDPGEVRGLLGPNGAGKTTLLRILFGLVRPDAGSIELFGRLLTTPDAAPALDRVGGFVEQPSFYPYLSGRANLELLAELDGDGAEAAIDEVLGRMALADRAGDRVGGYSSGMRQRLGIAAALLRAPRLLLLDEPTSGLDPAGARTLRALIGELAADGVAVLISSHQIGEVEEVCDSFTVLRRGRVVWDGGADELRAQAPGSAYSLDTSDDARALQIAARCPGVAASTGLGGGLALTVEHDRLDGFVLALADERVAVRRLELLVSPLESIFFALTAERPASEPVPVQRIPA
ncbi:MAG: ABC transporter ATP-binding protein [Solirubrobacterales bacterium]|nr:ABC transporter ATP-binding protein [Solirubrobacterales bacterium]